MIELSDDSSVLKNILLGFHGLDSSRLITAHFQGGTNLSRATDFSSIDMKDSSLVSADGDLEVNLAEGRLGDPSQLDIALLSSLDAIFVLFNLVDLEVKLRLVLEVLEFHRLRAGVFLLGWNDRGQSSVPLLDSDREGGPLF